MSDINPAAPAAPVSSLARPARYSAADAFDANHREASMADLAALPARQATRRPLVRPRRLSQSYLSCVLKTFVVSLAKTAGCARPYSAAEGFYANDYLTVLLK